jgi:hypothetical protein
MAGNPADLRCTEAVSGENQDFILHIASDLPHACSDGDCAESRPLQRKFKPPDSKRQQLTTADAVAIFAMRPKKEGFKQVKRGQMLQCKVLGPKYGVSAKTIRDIWSGRTWTEATKHIWTADDTLSATKAKTHKKTSLRGNGQALVTHRHDIPQSSFVAEQCAPFATHGSYTVGPNESNPGSCWINLGVQRFVEDSVKTNGFYGMDIRQCSRNFASRAVGTPYPFNANICPTRRELPASPSSLQPAFTSFPSVPEQPMSQSLLSYTPLPSAAAVSWAISFLLCSTAAAAAAATAAAPPLRPAPPPLACGGGVWPPSLSGTPQTPLAWAAAAIAAAGALPQRQ